jgi:GT2 family glycosyltransferase
LPPDRAVIGYVTGGWNRHEFTSSLLGICLEGKTPVDAVLALESGPNISTARNMLAADFLARPGSPPWLFMCDTDMVLEPDTVDRLVAAADPVDVPVLGGLCWSLDKGEKLPVMYELAEPEPGRLAFTRYQYWQRDTVMRVSATGAACLLIHRSALERVRLHAGDAAAPWFRESAVGAPMALMGEDLTFCLRCAAAGIPVHVHTGVRVGHMKTTMLI